MTNCSCILCKVFFTTSLLKKFSLGFDLFFVDNRNQGGIKFAQLYIQNVSELYAFIILDDKIELRIYDKNLDYGGFGYEEISEVFYNNSDLQRFLEDVVFVNLLQTKN